MDVNFENEHFCQKVLRLMNVKKALTSEKMILMQNIFENEVKERIFFHKDDNTVGMQSQVQDKILYPENVAIESETNVVNAVGFHESVVTDNSANQLNEVASVQPIFENVKPVLAEKETQVDFLDLSCPIDTMIITGSTITYTDETTGISTHLSFKPGSPELQAILLLRNKMREKCCALLKDETNKDLPTMNKNDKKDQKQLSHQSIYKSKCEKPKLAQVSSNSESDILPVDVAKVHNDYKSESESLSSSPLDSLTKKQVKIIEKAKREQTHCKILIPNIDNDEDLDVTVLRKKFRIKPDFQLVLITHYFGIENYYKKENNSQIKDILYSILKQSGVNCFFIYKSVERCNGYIRLRQSKCKFTEIHEQDSIAIITDLELHKQKLYLFATSDVYVNHTKDGKVDRLYTRQVGLFSSCSNVRGV